MRLTTSSYHFPTGLLNDSRLCFLKGTLWVFIYHVQNHALLWHGWLVLRPFFAEARIRSRASAWEILGCQSNKRTVFVFSEYPTLPCRYHSISTPHPPSSSDRVHDDQRSMTANSQSIAHWVERLQTTYLYSIQFLWYYTKKGSKVHRNHNFLTMRCVFALNEWMNECGKKGMLAIVFWGPCVGVLQSVARFDIPLRDGY